MWVRGLKLLLRSGYKRLYMSHPMWAWIETYMTLAEIRLAFVAPHVGAWIETVRY